MARVRSFAGEPFFEHASPGRGSLRTDAAGNGFDRVPDPIPTQAL